MLATISKVAKATFAPKPKMPVSSSLMPLDEFLKIPPCSIQRDTVANSKRWNRTRKEPYKLESVHLVCNIGRFPDGGRKLADAHTRQYRWGADIGEKPEFILAIFHEVENDEELNNLYRMLDSQDAVEKTKDKVFGALRKAGVKFDNRYLANANFVSAVKTLGSAVGDGDIYTCIDDYLAELSILDTMGNIHKGNMHQGVLAAFLMMIRKQPKSAKDFITKYLNDEYWESGGRYDAIGLLKSNLSARAGHRTAGDKYLREIMEETLWAAVQFSSGKTYAMGRRTSGQIGPDDFLKM